MYAAAGGASLAGRKARQHGRQPVPSSPHTSPVHPAPTGVRAYSCQHWEARLLAPPRPHSAQPSPPRSPCDVVECAAGRQAWQEAAALSVGEGGAAGGAARRCSVLGDHPGARRDKTGKWIRNNRVRDASYGSSSDSEGEAENTTGEPWGVARLLYAGLGTLSLGLVVYFVGTGDKGFKTPALRLVGPSLIVAGLACCVIRIAFCVFAKPCCRRRTNYKENRRLGGYGEGEELPLARGPRTGPAQCSPARRLDASSCDVSSLSSGEEDERMRRYRTTPAQPQQAAVQQITVQQKPESNRVPPPLSPAAASSMSQALRAATSTSLAISASTSLAIHASTSNAIPASTSLAIQASTSNAIPASKSNAIPVSTSNATPASTSNAIPTSSSLGTPASKSVTTSTSRSARTSAPKSITIPASTSIAIPNSALQTPVSPAAPSPALYGGSRRPPPRNVSFAGPPDGELVLSPSQLRS